MKQRILYLIQSKNPPVFKSPLLIRYTHEPQIGEAFLFASSTSDYCNFSTVQNVTEREGYTLIETLNSKYALYKLPQEN